MGWEEDEKAFFLEQSFFFFFSLDEAITYHCLNLEICAENGSHQGLKAGYSLPPSML